MKINLKQASYDIALQPDTKQIWISTTGNRTNSNLLRQGFSFYYETHDYNNEVVVYDYTGKFLGIRIKADSVGYSVKPMMNANAETMKLYAVCEKLSRQKGGLK